MAFYEVLKAACDEKNTSPTAVVQALGMSKSNATEWKKGQSPRLDVVIKIANYLGISAASLVDETEKES